MTLVSVLAALLAHLRDGRTSSEARLAHDNARLRRALASAVAEIEVLSHEANRIEGENTVLRTKLDRAEAFIERMELSVVEQ